MLIGRLLVLIFLSVSITAILGDDTKTSRQEVEARITALTAEDARDLYLKAEAGDPAAQYILGRAYKVGRSLARNDAEATNLIRKSAAQGYVLAEMELATMYLRGDGVPQDAREGMRWMRKAAEQRDSMAQFTLGYSLELQGNTSEAVSWYQKAAEQGLTLAQTALGFFYEQGKGVPQSDKEAVLWYRKAADQNDSNAQSNLGSMYYAGKGVEKDFAEAARWYRKSAENGWMVGQINIANMYVSGEGVPKDYVAAYMWYSLAALSGDVTSRKIMEVIAARMKSEEIAEAKRRAEQWSSAHDVTKDVGGGVVITEKRASSKDLDTFQKMKNDAERGDPKAQVVLGEAYYRVQDYQNALVWFRKSAQQGYASGQYNLGVLYLEGSGTAKDEGEAQKWFLKAAEQGDLFAMNNLVAAYYYGNGVSKDLVATYMWSLIAASLGDAISEKNLVAMAIQLPSGQRTEAEGRASQWLIAHRTGLEPGTFRNIQLKMQQLSSATENVLADLEKKPGIALAAITSAAADPFTGTWHMKGNVTGLSNTTMQLTSKEMGPITYMLKVDGETFDWSIRDRHEVMAKFDSKEYKSENADGSTVQVKRLDVNTIEMIKKVDRAGFLGSKQLWQIKGNTLTITTVLTGNQGGKPFVMEFERMK
jgi:TPR repeat protein